MADSNLTRGTNVAGKGFVNTDGKYILDGQNNRITFRGTNFGGWLQQEGWLSPLGNGGIDRKFFARVSADSQNGNHSPNFAIDEIGSTGNISGNLITFWQSAITQGSRNIQFKVVFDRARTFNSIVLETGPNNKTEYIRGCFLEVGDDGATWREVAGVSVDESKKDAGIVTLSFGEQTAKIIRIKPDYSGPDIVRWTIADINICISDEYTIRNNLIRRFGETQTNELYAAFQNNWITEQDIQNISDMNMNFIRVPVYWMDFALSDGTIRTDAASGFAKLDWVLRLCAEKNIYVLIDLHGAPGGSNGWASSGQAGPIPTELFSGDPQKVKWNQDLLIKIWTHLAARYKDNPTVGAYGLLNELVLGFPETSEQLDIKYGLMDRLYTTVRSIDADHIIIFEEFGDWTIAENRPERAGWKNYMFEKHPYDMGNGNNWWAQRDLANGQVEALSAVQDKWNIPLLVGEFCLYSFVDVWDDFLSQVNKNGISWTNWTYKVDGTIFESGGGNWGYYNTYRGGFPDIIHDSFDRIRQIWNGVKTTESFSINKGLINTVKRRAGGSVSSGVEVLDLTGAIATASDNSPYPDDNIKNIFDDNPGTRWSNGAAQTAGMWLQVDLGMDKKFDMINLDAGNWFDYPNRYKVSVSNDGNNFSDVELDTFDIGFGQKIVVAASKTQTARFVKITLLDGKPQWWSIAIFQLIKRS